MNICTRIITTPRRGLAAVAICACVVLAGCGDDTDDLNASEPAVTAGGDGDASEYCTLIEQIGDEMPNDEEFDQILAVAPAEIADNLAIVVAAFRDDPDGAFADPAVAENFPAIEAYESETCGGEPPAEIDPDAQLVTAALTEYAFDLTTTPEAGPVSFVLTNEGQEPHEMILVRLVDDVTLDEALAADDPVAEGLVDEVGFAGPVLAGGEAVLNADLTPGRYVMVCFIPAPDGTPHAEKGMITEFTIN